MDLKHPSIFLIIVSILIINVQVPMAQNSEENLNVLDQWLEWSNRSNLLEIHLYEQAVRYLDIREDEIAKLQSESDWGKRRYKVKSILLELVGPFPDRTPLKAKIMGTIQKPGFRVEKIIYESMPDYHVSGALFIPDGIKGKSPAIMYFSGHTWDSFRRPSYQLNILNLVKKGFIVFAIDPMGQGERVQYSDDEKIRVGLLPNETTAEHSFANNQCLLTGSSAARYWVWDGIRAVDYLLTRPEVDAERIGATGHSGGGTQTAYLAAFDERVAAAAPSGYICGYRRLLGTIGPQDGEQIFPHGISSGIDHADLIEVFAPRPYLIVSTTRDFFSIQGARETFREVRKAYAAYGKEENLRMTEDDFEHGYTRKNREAIYGFFQEIFNMPGNPAEEDLAVLSADELKVTPTGNVMSSLKEEMISSLNGAEAQKLISHLKKSRENLGVHVSKVKIRAQELSGYIAPVGDDDPVFRGRYQRDGYSVERLGIRGEGDYIIPILLMIPDGEGKHPALVYIHPDGKTSGDSTGGWTDKLVKRGFVVAVPDVIGTGETRIASNYPGRPGSNAVIIGRTMVGIHAGDIIRVVNMLRNRNEVEVNKIAALAFDELCPALLHAAAFDTCISKTALLRAPVSYAEIVNHRLYHYSLSFQWGVAGALKAYDLPDLAGCVAPRRLLLAELKNSMKDPASAEMVQKTFAFPYAVYSKENVSDHLRIIQGTVDEHMDAIIQWLVDKF